MAKSEEVAAVIDRIFQELLETPVDKTTLVQLLKSETNESAYSDAVGALRVLGFIESEKNIISLTSLGRAAAENVLNISAIEIIKAFRTQNNVKRQPAAKGETWLPSQDAILKSIKSIPDQSTRALISIRRNVQEICQRTSRRDKLFSLGIYTSAIDREFERRMMQPDSDWFKWPETDAPGGDGSVGAVDFMSEGMLSAVGYRVGIRNGLHVDLRRLVLQSLFESTLPPLFPNWYMEKWGPKGTAQRLYTLAHTIAALTRNLKRRHDEKLGVAIREYESDLEFLFDTYYVRKFGFDWPDTEL